MRPMREEVADGFKRWQGAAWPLAQSALAAGIAWVVAVHVVGHRAPFFAPCAAVICLGITLGQRLRRSIELIVGVGLGIGIGDVVITAFGTGPWQIALLVAVAMSAAILLDGGAVITVQAAVSAVLVATLYFPGETSGVSRMVDGLIGGSAALAVVALLPADPLTVVHREASRVLGELAGTLHGVSEALEARNSEAATAVLARARNTQHLVDDLERALRTGDEIAAIAPIRWVRRAQLEPYLRLMPPVDYALRNARVLIRRAVRALRDDEVIPDALCEALEALGDSVQILCAELVDGRAPTDSKPRLLAVARRAGTGMITGGAFSSTVLVAQLRSITVDMLQATGMTRDEALAALPSPPPAGSRAG